jgi:hypothetical protein
VISRVIRLFVKETGGEVRRNTVCDLLCFLIQNMELERLFAHEGSFVGWTDLDAREQIVGFIKSLLGNPNSTDENQSVWTYDDLNIRAWPEKNSDREIFKVEMLHKI